MTGVLEVLDHTGDTKHMWDSEKSDEVDAARAVFDTLKRKGYALFRAKKDGDKGTLMQTFDPDAERLIAVPPMVGG